MRPQNLLYIVPNAAEPDPVTEDENSLPEISSDSDIPLEPRELLSKYLELQTRLFKRQPELTHVELRRTKGNKTKKSHGQFVADGPDPISRKLLRRIIGIQSDILFDKEEGYEKWAELRLDLLREAANRKKLHLDEDPVDLRQAPTSRGDDTSSSQTFNSNNTTDDEDSSVQLGDFFSSLPESQVDKETGKSNVVKTDSNGASIIVRDFGKTQGLSPRRILTEACKAR